MWLTCVHYIVFTGEGGGGGGVNRDSTKSYSIGNNFWFDFLCFKYTKTYMKIVAGAVEFNIEDSNMINFIYINRRLTLHKIELSQLDFFEILLCTSL